MFNIETDRECLNNIADVARYAELRAQMEQTMSESLHTEGDPRVRGKGDLFDEYPYANVRERNFYRQYLDDPNSVSAGWVNPSDFEASGPQLP